MSIKKFGTLILRYQCTPNLIIFQNNCFSLFQIDLIASFYLKKFYQKRMILSKVINEKRFFPLSLIDCCQHTVTRSKFALKDHVRDAVLCDFHTIVFPLVIAVLLREFAFVDYIFKSL